jgi:hypothetical protein
MFRISEENLKEYPALFQYLHSEAGLDGLLAPEAYDTIYILDVKSNVNNDKKRRDLSLLEICVMLGLARHIDDIAKKTDIIKQLTRRQYRTFRVAISNSALEILDKLIQLLSENPIVMIRPYNYRAYMYAVKTGNIKTIKKIIQLADTEKDKMFASHGYLALNIALEKNYQDILFCLLRYPSNFTYAIKHKKYTIALFAFIAKYIGGLSKSLVDVEEDSLPVILCIVSFLLDNQQSPSTTESTVSRYLSQLMLYPSVRNAIQS